MPDKDTADNAVDEILKINSRLRKALANNFPTGGKYRFPLYI